MIGRAGNGVAVPVAEERITIDALDRKLIEVLQHSGREPFRRIAERLSISESTVRARYRRLVEHSVLKVVGITNPLTLGFGAMALLAIRASEGIESAVAEARGWRETTYVVTTTGRFDLLVEVVCADRAELVRVVDRARALPAVQSVEAFLYLELTKQTYEWGVRDQQDDRGTA